VNGVLAGTVTLHTGTPPNAPHRAEVQKLLVHPAARRHGLARALMQRVEREAEHAGRSLLTLDTRAGHAAEHLYRELGWQEGGRIPGYAMNADGTPGDAVFFHCNTLHSAGKNLSDAVKYSLVFTYHGASNAPMAGTRSASVTEVELNAPSGA